MLLVLCAREYFTRFPDFTVEASWLIVGPENSIRRLLGTVLSAKRPGRSLEEPFYTASYDETRREEPIETANFGLRSVEPIFVLSQNGAKEEVVVAEIAEGRRKERKEKRLPRVKSRRRLFVVCETAADKSTSSFLFPFIAGNSARRDSPV